MVRGETPASQPAVKELGTEVGDNEQSGFLMPDSEG
jgi:hypothetical protein